MPKRRKGSEDANDNDHGGNGRASKSKKGDDDAGGSNAIPIFLKKTYRMIETCDSNVCSWAPDGEMFVVKNPVGCSPSIIIIAHMMCTSIN